MDHTLHFMLIVAALAAFFVVPPSVAAAIFFLLVVHFWLVRKHGISPVPGRAQGDTLRFTNHLAHLAKYAAILTGLVLLLAVLRPPVIGPAPVEGIEVTKPPWIFLPLFAIECISSLGRISGGRPIDLGPGPRIASR